MPANNIEPKIIKIEVTKNYIISDYKNPPTNQIIKYTRKEILTKHGQRDLITFAVTKQKDGSTKLIPTSLWRPIKSASGRRILKLYLKKYPNKVKFHSPELRKQFLEEQEYINTKSITMFMEQQYEIYNSIY